MMEPDFWLQKWREGRIGFHQDAVTPMLERHWNAVGAPAGSRVFVPLCGKSLDMAWLAARGHRVLGVELSRIAVEQFFKEQDLAPAITHSHLGDHYVAHEFELIVGDAFALDLEILAGCSAVLDRAALIALPEKQRRRYVDTAYANLPADCRGLLVTLEYQQQQMEGPPFSVIENEVRTLFAETWVVESLERSDRLAQESHIAGQGVTSLEAVAYRLHHASALQESPAAAEPFVDTPGIR